jgi:hypothetical protein
MTLSQVGWLVVAKLQGRITDVFAEVSDNVNFKGFIDNPMTTSIISIMLLRIMSFSIMSLSIMTFCIMAKHCHAGCHYPE